MSLYVQVPIQQIADGLTAIGWSSAGGGGDATLSYGSTVPATPVNGTLWYDTTATLLKLYTGGTWTTINVTAETIATISGYATTAQSAANTATQKLTEFKAIQVTATTLSAGADATASYNSGTGVITLGIPTGATGIKGVDGEVSTAQLNTAISGITKTSLGLANVDNTSDTNKPVSTAQATAIALKADSSALANKSDVGHGHTALTGLTVTALKETSVAMAANDIDLATGNLFTKTISGSTTLTVSNIPTTGVSQSFILELTNGGSGTITWFSGAKFAKGTAPTLTASGKDIIGCYTLDGGTTWNVLVLGLDVK